MVKRRSCAKLLVAPWDGRRLAIAAVGIGWAGGRNRRYWLIDRFVGLAVLARAAPGAHRLGLARRDARLRPKQLRVRQPRPLVNRPLTEQLKLMS